MPISDLPADGSSEQRHALVLDLRRPGWGGAVVVMLETPDRQVNARHGRRRLRLLVLTLTVALVAAAAGAWLNNRRRPAAVPG